MILGIFIKTRGGVLDLLEVMIPNVRVLFLFVALIPPWSHGDS